MTKLWLGQEQVSLKPMHKDKVRTMTLTFDLATWFLFVTHSLVMMIICAKLFSNSTMQDTFLEQTNENTRTITHTHTQGKLYMPFHHLMTGIKMLNISLDGLCITFHML